MQDIVAVIKEKLWEIERKLDVRIIYACESGSRAWGFASPDSDYDVRFVYVRRTEDYLRLESVRDVIEYELNDVYDITGWDLRKFLQLLRKSNPSALEWARSDVVYRRTPDWERVLPCCRRHFSSQALMKHYVSMARNNVRSYLEGPQIPLKKYLYMLRPLLAAEWIRDHGSMAPMSFDALAATELPDALKGEVARLLELKRQEGEMSMGERIPSLDGFILERLEFFRSCLEGLEDEAPSSWDDLNACFAELIGWRQA